MQPAQSDFVCVDRNRRGEWEVELGERPERISCPTLDEARRIARRMAARRGPCELIVRDAYHRVIVRERIGDPARR